MESIISLNESIRDLVRKRMELCKHCPLYKSKYFVLPICNDKLYLNPKNNDVSTHPKEGYTRGCGCSLDFRTNNPKAHCPCKKW